MFDTQVFVPDTNVGASRSLKSPLQHVTAYLKLTGQDQPEPPEPAGPTGVLVVPEKPASIEEWVQKYGLEARMNKPPPEAYEPDTKPK